MCLSSSTDDITKNVFENKYHAVLFSASTLEAAELSAQCVNQIRQNYVYQPLVFLGGSVLSSHSREDMPNAFDLVTNKLDVIVNSIENAYVTASKDNRS
jgi:methylmalonyl-CoA mutase cobalamin-binding subunit